MKQVLKALAAAAALVLTGAQAPAERVDYALTPVMAGGAMTAMQVDLRFRGQRSGETVLRLPEQWANQSELWRVIADIEAVSGARLRAGEGPARRVLTHRPGARVHVRYRVVQDQQGLPTAGAGNPYRPFVQPGYFHMIGGTMLAVPEINPASAVRVRAHLPRGWSFASDLEHNRARLGDVSSTIIVGGDFRVLREGAVRVAIRGEWGFDDRSFLHQVAEIIAGQRRFWGDTPEPYLVTVTPLVAPQEGMLSVGGTGLDDAFAFFATPNAEALTVTRTLAHEAMHTWIPGRIGGMPREGEAANYWLSEGFTDFYTGRMLVREGVWTPAQFAEDLNRILDEYARSPARTAPNAQILDGFWTDRDLQRLPYQRGLLLAWMWERRLRDNGLDFDDIVRGMRSRARGAEGETAVRLFMEAMSERAFDVSADVARYVEAGEAVLLPEDAFGVCGRVVTRETPAFHRGFDIAATQANNNIIAGVDPALPAYAAGMRDGMMLLRREGGEIGNGELEIGYVVRDGETERTIRYIPRGRGGYIAQRLDLAPDLAGERLSQCAALIGGSA